MSWQAPAVEGRSIAGWFWCCQRFCTATATISWPSTTKIKRLGEETDLSVSARRLSRLDFREGWILFIPVVASNSLISPFATRLFRPSVTSEVVHEARDRGGYGSGRPGIASTIERPVDQVLHAQEGGKGAGEEQGERDWNQDIPHLRSPVASNQPYAPP
jgi:hypothetical protein